jgi:hypothetical protein
LDGLADQSATAEEQAHRKRRLLKGPEEFHDVRLEPSEKEMSWSAGRARAEVEG